MNELQVYEPTVIEQLTRSENETQIATAKKFPRSIERFQKLAMTLATADVEVAMSCNYTLPRGGKNIEGPSVRLAEIVASTYGNLRVASRVIAIEDKSVVVEGVCTDLESNYAQRVEVRRRIVDRNGKRYNDDMINMTANAAGAVASRNAVFKVVPMAFVKKIAKKAKAVAIGNERTIDDRKRLMFEHFSGIGVTQDDILMKLEKDGIADITLKDIELLFGIYSAIDGGDATVSGEFPKEEKKTKKKTESSVQTPEQKFNTANLLACERVGSDIVDTAIKKLVKDFGKHMPKWDDENYEYAIKEIGKLSK